MNTQTSLALLLTLLLAPLPGEAAFKCWVNRDGIKECGATVPPEYAGQGHQELNKAGVKVRETGRAKTPEEFAAEKEAERAAAARAAAEAAASSAKAEEDRILLDSFASEDDIVMARDGRLTAIDVQVKFAQSTVAKLEADLAQRIAEAAEHERQGEPVPPKLESDIANVQKQIESQKHFIAEQEKEKLAVTQSHSEMQERYRDLRERARASEPDGMR
jgi:multidrug efflux pump subunit AcrA (membrane-fusion protein)